MNAFLVLEDGTTFKGKGFGAEGEKTGMIVFNRDMTGYENVLTNPLYSGHIVIMTYPLIGNYGISIEDVQPSKPHISGIVVRELCKEPSNWRSDETLNDYLKAHNIIGIEDIDTRSLALKLRDRKNIKGVIAKEI